MTSGDDSGDLGDLTFRRPTEADHPRVVDVIDHWWGSGGCGICCPRLWLEHFSGTSWIVEREDGRLAGFVVAFVSQDHPDTGYVHMIAAEPNRRRRGLGRALYERAFADLAERGRPPRGGRDVAGQPDVGRVPPGARFSRWTTDPARNALYGTHAHVDHDGPDEDRVVFTREL